MNLFKHTKHPHTPRNINLVLEAERAAAGFNQRIAIGLTKLMSAMLTFWIVGLFVTAWIVLQSTSLGWDKPPYLLLLTILNLPQISMMIALGVGQGVLNHHQELQSEEMFNTTVKTYSDIEQIVKHQEAQDNTLAEQKSMLLELLQKNTKP